MKIDNIHDGINRLRSFCYFFTNLPKNAVFIFLMNLHTVFHSNWTNLHIPTNHSNGVPFSLPPHQNLLSCLFLIITILTGVRLHCGLIYISVEHWTVYHAPGVKCVSLVKCLFGFIVCILVKLFVILLLGSLSLYILWILIYQFMIYEYFSHSLGFLFTVLCSLLCYRNFLAWGTINWVFYPFFSLWKYKVDFISSWYDC